MKDILPLGLEHHLRLDPKHVWAQHLGKIIPFIKEGLWGGKRKKNLMMA
jgi:hypothetical protein